MTVTTRYASTAPAREEIDALREPAVVEFGTDWCGYCQAAQPLVSEAFTQFPNVRHIKVEDGRGRPLGRSFGVKLWPTLIFLDQGKEVARLVRPTDAGAIGKALAQINGNR